MVGGSGGSGGQRGGGGAKGGNDGAERWAAVALSAAGAPLDGGHDGQAYGQDRTGQAGGRAASERPRALMACHDLHRRQSRAGQGRAGNREGPPGGDVHLPAAALCSFPPLVPAPSPFQY